MSVKPPRKELAKRAAPRKAAVKAAATPRGGKKRALEAAERAKEAGAVGPNGTDGQRAMRDGAILAMLAAGSKQDEVASDFRISLRTVQAIAARQRDAPSVLDAVPMEIVDEFASGLRQLRADAYVTAWRESDRNPAVALGALKLVQHADDRLLELMLALGALPENLQLVMAESTLRRMASEMVDVMMKLESGDAGPEEALAVFRSVIEVKQAPQLPAV